MTTLLIKITPEVLERAKMCAFGSHHGENCAIGLAVRDIFPQAWVCTHSIHPFGLHNGNPIALSKPVRDFIHDFDLLWTTPEQRPLLPPFSFTVKLPDEVVERIDISDIEKSLTLEIVNN